MPSKHVSSNTIIALVQLFLLLVPIATAVIVLTYLGPWVSHDNVEVDPQDWRRKWLVIFSWLTVITVAMNILLGVSMIKK